MFCFRISRPCFSNTIEKWNGKNIVSTSHVSMTTDGNFDIFFYKNQTKMEVQTETKISSKFTNLIWIAMQILEVALGKTLSTPAFREVGRIPDMIRDPNMTVTLDTTCT